MSLLACSFTCPAISIRCLTAELAIHQVVKVILLRCPLQDKFVSHVEEWTGPGLRIRQILLLVIGKTFLIYHCNFAFMLHVVAPP